MTKTKLTRRGRPPTVTVGDDGTYNVTVKGLTYHFRGGRAGGSTRTMSGADMDYARALVNRHISVMAASV